MFSGISVLKAIKLSKANLLGSKIALGFFFIALTVIMFLFD
jgi:hypothetical protein